MKLHQTTLKYFFIVFVTFGVAAPINAHTGLKESIPAADSRIQVAPSQLELTFSGPVRLIKLDVVGGSQPRVTFTPASEPISTYRIPAANLVNGEYEVAWAAIGADGHIMANSFRFVVDLNTALSAP